MEVFHNVTVPVETLYLGVRGKHRGKLAVVGWDFPGSFVVRYQRHVERVRRSRSGLWIMGQGATTVWRGTNRARFFRDFRPIREADAAALLEAVAEIHGRDDGWHAQYDRTRALLESMVEVDGVLTLPEVATVALAPEGWVPEPRTTKYQHGEGECQVCARTLSVDAAGRLNHHGYTQVFGWNMGGCHGTGHLPFPETDALEKALAACNEYVAKLEADLAELDAGRGRVRLEAGARYVGRKRVVDHVWVTTREEAQGVADTMDRKPHWARFGELSEYEWNVQRANERHRLTSEIRHNMAAASSLEGRIGLGRARRLRL